MHEKWIWCGGGGGGDLVNEFPLINFSIPIFSCINLILSNKQRHDKNKQYLRKLVHVSYNYIQCVLKKIKQWVSFTNARLWPPHMFTPPGARIIDQLDLESKHHFIYSFELNYLLLPQDLKYMRKFIELLHVCFCSVPVFFFFCFVFLKL